MPGFHYWLTSGIDSLLALSAGMWYDTTFFCASVLPDIKRNLCDGKGKKTLRGVYTYLDHALAHNAEWPRQEIARIKGIRLVYPAYSPDAAPIDFFLFSYLKGEVEGFRANLPADILSEIRRIFREISKEVLMGVYDEWITRLEWTTEHKAQYYHTE
jgi:hypothetical protein